MAIGTNLNQARKEEFREVKPSFSNNIYVTVQVSLTHVASAVYWVARVVVLETSRFCSSAKRSKHFPAIKRLYNQATRFFISDLKKQEDKVSSITKLKKEILASHKDTYTKPEEVSFLFNAEKLQELSFFKDLEEDLLKKITPEQFALFFGAKIKSDKELIELYKFYETNVQEGIDPFIEQLTCSSLREQEFVDVIMDGRSKTPKAATDLLKKVSKKWAKGVQSIEKGRKEIFVVGTASERSDKSDSMIDKLLKSLKLPEQVKKMLKHRDAASFSKEISDQIIENLEKSAGENFAQFMEKISDSTEADEQTIRNFFMQKLQKNLYEDVHQIVLDAAPDQAFNAQQKEALWTEIVKGKLDLETKRRFRKYLKKHCQGILDRLEGELESIVPSMMEVVPGPLMPIAAKFLGPSQDQKTWIQIEKQENGKYTLRLFFPIKGTDTLLTDPNGQRVFRNIEGGTLNRDFFYKVLLLRAYPNWGLSQTSTFEDLQRAIQKGLDKEGFTDEVPLVNDLGKSTDKSRMLLNQLYCMKKGLNNLEFKEGLYKKRLDALKALWPSIAKKPTLLQSNTSLQLALTQASEYIATEGIRRFKEGKIDRRELIKIYATTYEINEAVKKAKGIEKVTFHNNAKTSVLFPPQVSKKVSDILVTLGITTDKIDSIKEALTDTFGKEAEENIDALIGEILPDLESSSKRSTPDKIFADFTLESLSPSQLAERMNELKKGLEVDITLLQNIRFSPLFIYKFISQSTSLSILCKVICWYCLTSTLTPLLLPIPLFSDLPSIVLRFLAYGIIKKGPQILEKVVSTEVYQGVLAAHGLYEEMQGYVKGRIIALVFANSLKHFLGQETIDQINKQMTSFKDSNTRGGELLFDLSDVSLNYSPISSKLSESVTKHNPEEVEVNLSQLALSEIDSVVIPKLPENFGESPTYFVNEKEECGSFFVDGQISGIKRILATAKKYEDEVYSLEVRDKARAHALHHLHSLIRKFPVSSSYNHLLITQSQAYDLQLLLFECQPERGLQELSYNETSELLVSKYALLGLMSGNVCKPKDQTLKETLSSASRLMIQGKPDITPFMEHFFLGSGKEILKPETRDQVNNIAEYFEYDSSEKYTHRLFARKSADKHNYLFTYCYYGMISSKEKNVFKEGILRGHPYNPDYPTVKILNLTEDYLFGSPEGKFLGRLLKTKEVVDALKEKGIDPQEKSDFELRALIFDDLELLNSCQMGKNFLQLRNAWFMTQVPPRCSELFKETFLESKGANFSRLTKRLSSGSLWSYLSGSFPTALEKMVRQGHEKIVTFPLLENLQFGARDQTSAFFENYGKVSRGEPIKEVFRKKLFSETNYDLVEIRDKHFLNTDNTKLLQDPENADQFVLEVPGKKSKILKSDLSDGLLSILKRKELQDYELIGRHKSMQVVKAITFFNKNPLLLNDPEFLLQLELLLLGIGSLESQFKNEPTSVKLLGDFFKKHLSYPNDLQNKLHLIEIGIHVQKASKKLDPDSGKYFPDFKGELNTLLEKAQKESYEIRITNTARILQAHGALYFGTNPDKLSQEEKKQAIFAISRLLYSQKNLREAEDSLRHKEYRDFLRKTWMPLVQQFLLEGDKEEVLQLIRLYTVDSGVQDVEISREFLEVYYLQISLGENAVLKDFADKNKSKLEDPLLRSAKRLVKSLGNQTTDALQTSKYSYFFPESKITVRFTIDQHKKTKTKCIYKQHGKKQYRLLSALPKKATKGARYWIEENPNGTQELLLMVENRLITTYLVRDDDRNFTILGEKQLVGGQEAFPISVNQCSHSLKSLEWFYPLEKTSLYVDPTDLQKLQFFRMDDLNLLFKIKTIRGKNRAALVGNKELLISESQKIPDNASSLNRHANSLFLETASGEKQVFIVPQNIKTLLTSYLLKTFSTSNLPPLAQKYLGSITKQEKNTYFSYELNKEGHLLSKDPEAMAYLLVSAFTHGDFAECDRVYKELQRISELEPLSSQTLSYINLLCIPFLLSDDPQTSVLALKLEAFQRKNQLLQGNEDFVREEFDNDLTDLGSNSSLLIFRWVNLQRKYSKYLDKLSSGQLKWNEKLKWDEELFVIKSITKLNAHFISKLDLPEKLQEYTDNYLVGELTSTKIKRRYQELIIENGGELSLKDKASYGIKSLVYNYLAGSGEKSKSSSSSLHSGPSKLEKISGIFFNNPLAAKKLTKETVHKLIQCTDLMNSFTPLAEVPCTVTEILPEDIPKHFLVYYRLATNEKDPDWDQDLFDQKRSELQKLLSSWQGHFVNPAAAFCFSALGYANQSPMPYLTAEQLELLIMGYEPSANKIEIIAQKGVPEGQNPLLSLQAKKEMLESSDIESLQIEIELETINTLLRKYENLEKRIEKRRLIEQRKENEELDGIPPPPKFPINTKNLAGFFQDLLSRSRRDMLLARGINLGASTGLQLALGGARNIKNGVVDAAVVISGATTGISKGELPDKEVFSAAGRLMTNPLVVASALPIRAPRLVARTLKTSVSLGLTTYRTVTSESARLSEVEKRQKAKAKHIADTQRPMSEALSDALSQREAALNQVLSGLKEEYFTEEIRALEKEEHPLDPFQCAEDAPEVTKAFINEMNEKMQVFKDLPKERITVFKFKGDKSPEKLQKDLTSLREDIEALLVKERKDIERFVNRLPKESDLTDEQLLESFGKRGKKNPITFEKIYACFLKDDYKNLLEHSHLKEEDIPLLKQKIYLHMIISSRFNTLFATFDSLSFKNTKDFSGALSVIGKQLASNRVYTFKDRSESERLIRTNLAFECGSKKMLRPKQRELLKQTLTSKSSRVVLEAIMGIGKSFVLSPEIGFFMADGAQLMLFIWPATVAKANIDFMGKWSDKLYAQTAFTLNTSRNREWTEDESWALATSLSKAVLSRSHLHLTKEQTQGIELVFIEHLFGKGKSKVSDESLEQMKKALIMIRKGKRSIDEFPLASDPIQELNFPLGKKKSMPKEWISCMENVMKLFSSDPDISKIIDISTPPYLSINEEVYKSQLLPLLSEKIVPILIKEAFSVEQREALSPGQVEKLETYISGKAKSVPDFIKTSEKRGVIELYKGLLTVIVPKALEQVPNVDYTLSKLGELEYAIPSAGNKNPKEGSTIRNIFAAYVKTYILYQHDRLNREQIIKFVTFLRNLAKAEQEKTKIPIAQTQAAKYFKAQVEGHDLFSINNGNREEIYQKLKDNNQVATDYLRLIIAPTMTFHTENLSNNSSNFNSMTESFIGLTGTPEKGTQPFDTLLLEDRGTGGKSMSISAKKCQEKSTIRTIEIQTPKVLLQTLLDKHFTEEAQTKTRALIDVGALLRGFDNQEAAQIILNRLTEKNCGVEAVVYYDSKKGFVALEKGKTTAVLLSESSVSPEKRFTYYDQARTVGSDIPQCKYAQAIVTIGEKTTFDDFAQGSFRMRGLETLQQKLTLVMNKEVEKLALREREPGKNGTIDFRDAASFMLKNGAGKSAERTYLSDKNDMGDIVRRAVLDKALFASSIGESRRIAKAYETVFIQKFNTNLTEMFGGIGKMVSPTLVFNVLRASLLQTLEEGNSLIFTVREIAEIKEKLEKIGKDPKRYPKDVYVLTEGSQIVNGAAFDNLNGESQSEAAQDQDQDQDMDTELDQDQNTLNAPEGDLPLPDRSPWRERLNIHKEDWIDRFSSFKLKVPKPEVQEEAPVPFFDEDDLGFRDPFTFFITETAESAIQKVKETVSSAATKVSKVANMTADGLGSRAMNVGEIISPETPLLYPLQDALKRASIVTGSTIPPSLFSESIFVSNNLMPKHSGRIFRKELSSLDKRQESIATALVVEKVVGEQRERKLILLDSDGVEYWTKKLKEDRCSLVVNRPLHFALYNIATQQVVSQGKDRMNVEALQLDLEFQSQITQLKFINGDLNYSDSQKKILRDLIKRAGPEKMEQAFTTLHKDMGHGSYKGSEVEQLFLDIRGVPLKERFTL